MKLDLAKLKLFNQVYDLAIKAHANRVQGSIFQTTDEYSNVDALLEKAMYETFGNPENFLEASYKGVTLLSYAEHKKPPEPLTKEIYDSMYKDRSTIGWALSVRFDCAASMKRLEKEAEPRALALFQASMDERYGSEHPANKARLALLVA